MLRLKSGWTTKLKEINPGGGPGVGQEAGRGWYLRWPTRAVQKYFSQNKNSIIYYLFIYLFTYL